MADFKVTPLFFPCWCSVCPRTLKWPANIFSFHFSACAYSQNVYILNVRECRQAKQLLSVQDTQLSLCVLLGRCFPSWFVLSLMWGRESTSKLLSSTILLIGVAQDTSDEMNGFGHALDALPSLFFFVLWFVLKWGHTKSLMSLSHHWLIMNIRCSASCTKNSAKWTFRHFPFLMITLWY